VGFKPDLEQPTGFLQCFDTVGLVFWSVKIVPEMTYNMLSEMLSLYTTTTGDAIVRKSNLQIGGAVLIFGHLTGV